MFQQLAHDTEREVRLQFAALCPQYRAAALPFLIGQRPGQCRLACSRRAIDYGDTRPSRARVAHNSL
jgi:hypothetical protein